MDDRRLVAALAVTQTVGYGVLYYSFAVFLAPMARDLGAGTTAVTGAATVSVLVNAAASVPVGRWLDRRGGRGLMTAGSALGTGAVLAWSQVRTVAGLYVVFALIGLASAMTLYESAFAVLVARFGPDGRARALLAVTVVAGFASSIFLPLAGLLEVRFGWRTAVVVLAAIHAIGTVPPHALVVPAGGMRRVSPTAEPVHRAAVLRAALRDRGFWLLAAGFVVHAAALSAMAVHLVSYLRSVGHAPAFAATVAGLLGVLSVSGRIVTTGLRRRYPVSAITGTVFVLQAVGLGLLPVIGSSTAGAVGCVLLFGLGFGVATLARPALLTGRYDSTVYATLSGTLALPAALAKAGAPLGAAVVAASTAGYPMVMVTAAACCAVAGLVVVAAGRVPRPGTVDR